MGRSYAVITIFGVVAAGLAVTAGAASHSPQMVRLSDAVPVSANAPVAVYRPASSAVTPVKHLVVIFDENISFDHYFGTYPNATNQNGSPFHAKASTPTINGLTPALLTAQP